MKLSSLILKLTKHVIQIWNEDRSDTILLENTCYVHNGKLNGSTSLENDNMCYVSFRIREQENVYLGVVKFKTEDQKFLGRLLIFTPIPLNAQDVWSLNQFPRR